MKASNSKFAMVLDLLKPVTPIVRMGFAAYNLRQTPFNAAMAYNLANAVDGEYPNYKLNIEKVLLAKGPLEAMDEGSVLVERRMLTVNWTVNKRNYDNCWIAAICEVNGEAVFIEKGNSRLSCYDKIHLPETWEAGAMVHVYAGFRNNVFVSDSTFLGTIRI